MGVAAFLRSRLHTLLLWNAGIAAGAAVLVLSPAVSWKSEEALYALFLNLGIQLVWLTIEAARRGRLSQALRADGPEAEALAGPSDEDLLLGEIGAFKRRLDERLRAEREEIEAYGDYLVGFTHELKTPLTSLRLGLEAAREDSEQFDPSGLLDETERMGGLVEQALFYARSQSFSSDYVAQSVHLPGIVNGLLSRNARAFILGRLHPEFGAGFRAAEANPPAWRVTSDPVWLGFMLQQLLSNALKYAPPDSRLFIDLQRTGGRILLSLQDQGPGASPEDLPRVFERGFTGQRRERRGAKASSTGMGLYLVSRLAAMLGHEVGAENVTPPERPLDSPLGFRVSIIFADDAALDRPRRTEM